MVQYISETNMSHYVYDLVFFFFCMHLLMFKNYLLFSVLKEKIKLRLVLVLNQ